MSEHEDCNEDQRPQYTDPVEPLNCRVRREQTSEAKYESAVCARAETAGLTSTNLGQIGEDTEQ